MKKAAFLFSIFFAFAVAASAQGLAIGAAMENFSLADTSGKMQTLNEMKGTKGAVIIFVSAKCPVVYMYNERMNQIASDYKAKGINVIGINSNVTENGEQIKAHASLTFNFPVLIDKNSLLADKLGATRTPEVYFVDAKNTLLYHGAIDNDRTGNKITDKYLRTAFDSSLAGKKIEKTSTAAFGCTIKRAGDE
ncbi:MAG: redoxin domain-containing protein [Chloracidobacterium sp.]|nr:redoxin domain-containing protein [Chloracidobacterium sp.]